TLADRHIMSDRLRSMWDVMGIVTRRAGHSAAQETCRFAQSIRGSSNFEFVVVHTRHVIEVDERVRECVPWNVRKRRTIVAAYPKRQRRARRLEMTLHAGL